MSVKYTRIPLEDSDSSVTFDFSSPFTYDEDKLSKYRSAFTYSSNGNAKISRIAQVEQQRTCLSYCDKFNHILVTFGCLLLFVVTFPVTVWCSFKKVPERQRLVVFRLGRLKGSKGPGLVFVLPCVDKCHKVDIGTRAFKVPPKQILTADNGIIEVGADIYYRIASPVRSIINVQNLDRSTRVLVEASLHNILMEKKLAQIESQRNDLGIYIRNASNGTSLDWGVEISRIELSEIKILQTPVPRSTPTVMFPPGMGTGGGGRTAAVPEALQQLASVVLAAQGGQDEENGGESYRQKYRPDLLMGNESQDDWTHLPVLHNDDSPSPEEMVMTVRGVITDAMVKRVQAIYLFDLIGIHGGQYYLDLKNGHGSAGEGMPPLQRPDVIISLTLTDMQDIFQEKLKPFQAYMSGDLKVQGDLAAALRLEEVIQKATAEAASAVEMRRDKENLRI